jgi:endonuclease YncB( thermonuclease family)
MLRKVVVLVVAVAAVRGTAGAAELVEVLSGDVLVAQSAGERFILKLAGIWVPSPAGGATEPQYRGEEARRYVLDALAEQASIVTDARSSGPQGPLLVRVLVGGEGGEDLAVLLAEAGFGMCDRTGAADRAQGDAICSAERRARRERRGIHDGGFQQFEATKNWHIDVGVLEVNPLLLNSRLAYYDGPVGGDVDAGRPPRADTIHRTPVEAIRDWGRSMGLPRDASRPGH